MLGSAAILEEDVVYGVGIQGGGKLLSGNRHVQVSSLGLRDETATQGRDGQGRHRGHELDLDRLHRRRGLARQHPDSAGQATDARGLGFRILAWNLAVAVSKYDPNNPRLAPLGPKFKDACHKIVDLFTTGPLAGKAEQDCLRNTLRLFPSA